MQKMHDNDNIVPPWDVYWVWHCHMLSPTDYIKDCKTIIGVVIHHRLQTVERIRQLQAESEQVLSEFLANIVSKATKCRFGNAHFRKSPTAYRRQWSR